MNKTKFIEDIKNKSCLWNVFDKNYNKFEARKKAWEQIAKNHTENWSKLSPSRKKKAVQNLQKKWGHLRDYYIKKRRRMLEGESIHYSYKTEENSEIDRKLQFLWTLKDLVEKDRDKTNNQKVCECCSTDLAETEISQHSAESAQNIVRNINDIIKLEDRTLNEKPETEISQHSAGSTQNILRNINDMIKLEDRTLNKKPETEISQHLAESTQNIVKNINDMIKLEDRTLNEKPESFLSPEENVLSDSLIKIEEHSPFHFKSVSTNLIKPEPSTDKDIYDSAYAEDDRKFLLSLLPEMNEMNLGQKFQFKMKLMEALKEVKHPTVDPLDIS